MFNNSSSLVDIVNFKLRGSVSKEIFDNGLLASESAISYLQSNMDSLPLNIDDLMNLFGKWQDTGKYHEFSKNISFSRYFIAEEFIEFLTNQSIINGNEFPVYFVRMINLFTLFQNSTIHITGITGR